MPKEFDLAEFVRESAAKSGVPEKVEDPDVIREAVSLLLAARAKPLQEDEPRPSKRR